MPRNSLSVQVTAVIRHGHEVDAFYLLLGIGIGRLLMVGFHEVCVLFVTLAAGFASVRFACAFILLLLCFFLQ